jgi:hypothetical protein
MKRLIIICEGETEQEFCKDVLHPHFLARDIIIHNPRIKKTLGGIVKWEILRKEIINYLIQERNVFVTTFIDYYGIKPSYQFPGWGQSENIVNKSDRLDFLENKMLESLTEDLSYRFIPYIQLHEFEGLLFNDIEVFERNFTAEEITNYEELAQTIQSYPNPEDINTGRETAPSKRLERYILGYNKIVYGSLLAQDIGLDAIRAKSPRFNQWLTKVEAI